MALPRNDLRVAVVGVGNMGQNHVRGYSNLKNVQVVGVYDINSEKAEVIAKQYECAVFRELREIIGSVDAVSICSPSIMHIEHGLYFLKNDIACLIEKPLATTQDDCRTLMSAAEASSTVLMAGHIERFNPAVQTLSRILKSGNHKIFAMCASRMSMASKRISDVNVLLDLMIHDLDVVLSLVGAQPIAVAANSTRAKASDGADYVNALLTFEDGCIANLMASRITHNKIRTLNVSTDFGFVELDYINQDISIHRQDSDARLGPDNTYALDVASERVLVRRVEPLVLELQNFVEAVRGECAALITGADGLAALQLVQRIQDQIEVPK